MADLELIAKKLQELMDLGIKVDIDMTAEGIATEATLASILGRQSILDEYAISDIDADASPNYYGFLDADGNWYILKETVLAGADTYRYAKGTTDYSTNWTNRASLTYNLFSTEF